MNINRLKKARENLGLTQSQVATMLEISDGAYKNYEQGKREPNNFLLVKIADLYGVTTDYLLGREPQANPLTELNLTAKVDNEKFIELYKSLPEPAQQIFVDTMAKLSQAMQPKNTTRKSKT